MKFPILWHLDCLRNSKISALNYKKQIDDLQFRYDRLNAENIFYESQIIQAQKIGKLEFDKDKFMVKKSIK